MVYVVVVWSQFGLCGFEGRMTLASSPIPEQIDYGHLKYPLSMCLCNIKPRNLHTKLDVANSTFCNCCDEIEADCSWFDRRLEASVTLDDKYKSQCILRSHL